MESYKKDLEKRTSILTSVFVGMMEKLDNDQKILDEKKKECDSLNLDVQNLLVIVDCVKGRLDQLKGDLNDVYNGKDVDMRPQFQYSAGTIKYVEEKYEPQ